MRQTEAEVSSCCSTDTSNRDNQSTGMHFLVLEHGRVLNPLQDAQAVPCTMLVLRPSQDWTHSCMLCTFCILSSDCRGEE